MPALRTVQRWLWPGYEKAGKEPYATFRRNYTQARSDQADVWAEQVVDISNLATDRDTAAAARVRIEARIWAAGKAKPKKYGDRPAEVNVHNNTLVVTQEKAAELQDRKRRALQASNLLPALEA